MREISQVSLQAETVQWQRGEILNGFILGVQQDWNARDAFRGVDASELGRFVHLQTPFRIPNIREDKSDVQLQIFSVHG